MTPSFSIQSRPPAHRRISLALAVTAALSASGFLASSRSAHAVTYTKQNNTTTLDLSGSWSLGGPPTGTDVALWNNTVTAANVVTTGAGVTFGEIQILNPGGLVTINQGTAGLTLNGIGGVGIDMSAATQNLTIGATVALGASQSWNVASGRTLTVSGAISGGTNGLTLNGPGTLVLTGTAAGAAGTNANDTYTGTTTVNGGTLSITSAVLNQFNILSSLSSLAFGGGTFSVVAGSNVGTTTQNINGTTINTGAATFSQGRGANSKVVVNLGALTRGAGAAGLGGTVNFLPTSNNSFFSTTAANVNNIIGGWATLSNTDFAKAEGNAAAINAPAYTSDAWAAANNTTVTLASNAAYDTVTTNSLRFAAVASDTVNLTGANVISSGGILVSSAVTAGNSDVITGGTLSGAAAADLVVSQFGAGSLAINSIIADNTAATALTKSGPGLLTLGGANTFTGGIFLNAGTIQLTPGGTLNGNAVTFTNNSGGTLSLGGVSTSSGALATSAVLAATVPVVQNANATAATLTINSSTVSAYAGTIRDGAGGGALGLTLMGAGVQTLSGPLTYTGATNVAGGTLALGAATNLNASSGISVGLSGTLDVTALSAGQTIGSGKTLSGSGVILGSMTLGAGSATTPGGAGAIGTLSIGNLTLTSGSTINFEFGAGNDSFNITTGLTIGAFASNGFNLLTTAGGNLATDGSYTLFNYGNGTVTGFSNLTSSLIINAVGGLAYAFANDTTNHLITLTVSGTPSNNTNWISDTGTGNWSAAGNWSTGVVPGNQSDTANFVATSPNNPAHAVTLNANETVGAVTFNAASFYTIADAGFTLTLDNNTNNASITDANGSHEIATALSLTSTTVVTVANSADTLTLSGSIHGAAAGGLQKAGAGLLVLSGTNDYSGGTSINGGVLEFSSLANLGSGGISFASGTLLYNGNSDDISVRTVTLGAGGGTINVGSSNVSFANAIGNAGSGGLTKAGSGALSLAAGNTFTGATTVAAGTLNIAADTSLGAAPAAAATNLTINGGAALQFGAAITLNANRGVVLNGGTDVIDTNGFNVTIAGATSGTGLLDKIGPGTLTLSGASSATGGATIDAGTVALVTQANLPTGTLTLNGSAGITVTAGSAFSPVVNGTNFITSANAGQIQQLAVVTGSGTLTFGGNFVNDFTGNLTAFTGAIIANGGGYRFNGTAGGPNLTLNLGNFGASVRSAGSAAMTIGQLIGTNGALSGGTGGFVGAVTYTIGGKTVAGVPVDSNFAGAITNGASPTVTLDKVGFSTLTLSGANTYTGATLVDGGTLAITGGSLGVATADLQIAPANADTASVTIMPGATVNAARILIGANTANTTGGNGTLLQLGGTINAADWFSVGEVGVGTFTMLGGNLLVNSATGTNFEVATFGTSSGSVTIGGNSQLYLLNNASINMGAQNTTGNGVIDQNDGNVIFFSDSGTAIGGSGALALGAVGSGTYTYNLNGGTLTVPQITHSSGTGIFNFNGGTLQAAGDNAAFTNGFIMLNVQAGGAVIDTNGHNIAIDQVFVSGVPGDGGLTKLGAGTLALIAENTYTGATNINGGVLNVGGPEAPGTAGPLGVLGAISFGGGTLQYSVSNNADYSSRFSSTANQPVSIDTNGQSVTFASALGSAGGSLAVTDTAGTGTGALILTAANTYSGATNVQSGGVLIVTGSLSGTSGTAVASGAALFANGSIANSVTNSGTVSGSGTIAGNLTSTGGTVAPGATAHGIGTLTVGGSLALDSASTLSLVLGSTSNFSQVDTHGLSVNGSALQLTLSGYTPHAYDSFVIVLNGGTSSGTGFSNSFTDPNLAANPNLNGGQPFTAVYDASSTYEFELTGSFTLSGGANVTLLAVPEPQAAVTLFGGLGMLAGLQRFRRRRI